MRSGKRIVEVFDVIITKACHTDLRDYLNNSNTPRTSYPKRKQEIESDQLKQIILQCFNGLKTVVDAGLIHGDIKPSNILVDEIPDDHGSTPKIYLGDFGFSGVKHAGTPGFASLEKFSSTGEILEKSDMYSLGISCLYIISENDELFFTLRDNTFENSAIAEVVRSVPELALISQMMETDPMERIEMTKCKQKWEKMNIKRITKKLLIDHGLKEKDLKITFPQSNYDHTIFWHNRNKRLVLC